MWRISDILDQLPALLPVTIYYQVTMIYQPWCNVGLEVAGREESEKYKLMKHKVIPKSLESLESLVNMGNVCSSNNNNKVL